MKKEHIKVKIGDLKENPKNAKLHDDTLIKSSIEELGFIDPIVISGEDNIILSGHGRLKALKELGTEEVDVIKVTGWTDKQKEKYLLLSNKSVEKGGWDFDLLAGFDKEILEFAGFNEIYDDIPVLNEKREVIQPYKRTHILLSFHPNKFNDIKKKIEEITKIDGVEYEQSSN